MRNIKSMLALSLCLLFTCCGYVLMVLFGNHKIGFYFAKEINLKIGHNSTKQNMTIISTFAQCRQRFDEEFSKARLAWLNDPPIPAPLSAFLKQSTNNATVLYVVLTNTFLQNENDQWNRLNIARPAEQSWKVQLDSSGTFFCHQVLGPNGQGDSHGLTIVIECPLNLVDWAILPASLRFTLKYEQLESFEIFNYRIPKSVTKVTLSNLLACQLSEFKAATVSAICTQVGDDQMDRLPEWIEYHLAIGFNYFLIYVNEPSSDRYQDLLRPYSNVATVATFYVDAPLTCRGCFTQQASQNDCLYRLKGRSRWLGFLDADEFFHVYSENLPQLLNKKLTQNPDLGALWFKMWSFGPSTSHSADLKQSFNIGNTSFDSLLNSMIYRQSSWQPSNREKMIAFVDNVWFVSVHVVTNGGEMVVVAPQSEGRLVHYRTPSLPEFEQEAAKGLLVLDTSLRDSWGHVVIDSLTQRYLQ